MKPSCSPPGPEGAVVGIDIGATNCDIALASSQGILERARLRTRVESGPDQALARISARVWEMLQRSAARPPTDVTAIGVVSPGIVRETGIALSPNLPGWQDIVLGSYFRERFEVDSVIVSNDVKAAALAEFRSGALRNCDPCIYVNIGSGLAAALVVDGRVIQGAHHAAGEIGYLRTSTALGDPATAGRAPLEDIAGGHGLSERAYTLFGTNVPAVDLFARRDPVSQHVVHQGIGALGAALSGISTMLDPSRIAVGGGMTGSIETVLPVLAAYLHDTVPFPPDLVAAHFIEDASLHGALALALDAVERQMRGANDAPRWKSAMPRSAATTSELAP